MARSRLWGWLVTVVSVTLAGSACSAPGAATVNGTASGSGASSAAAAQAASPVVDASGAGEVQIADDLPPLPAGVNNAPRPAGVVRAVYEFAARHPEVLKYVPCFCGCERGGHKDNADCFVAGRDAAGKVTAWETHGMVCEICLDVGETAMRMHNSGASTADIRRTVEKKYASMSQMNHTHTPTPMPPGGGH